jgi:hypothetical protein
LRAKKGFKTIFRPQASPPAAFCGGEGIFDGQNWALSPILPINLSTSVEMTKDVYFLNRNYLYIMIVSKVENKDKRNTC